MKQPPKMKPLITRDELATRIAALGDEISRDFKDEKIVVVGVLKGSFVFLADLVREIKVPLRVEFIGVSSYLGTSSTGHVRITNDLTADIQGENVIIVEDIVDTGITLDFLMDTFNVRGPKSLRICTLLSKPKAHVMQHNIDYVGFEISNEFVIGYGLDLNEYQRQLPDIMQVQDEIDEDQTNQ